LVRDVCYIVEDIEIKVFFPKGLNNSNLSVSVGDFDYNTENNIGIWKIARLDKENNSNVKMIGNLFTDANVIYNANCILNMKCIIDRFSISGGRVAKVTITKNNKNNTIYKGEKSKTIIKSLEMNF